MKYCPKCGAKLSARDKFCDHCGADVSQVPAAQQMNRPQMTQNASQPGMIQPNQKKPMSKLEKNRKLRNNCLIIAACVLFLAAAGMIFFTLQSNNSQNADQAEFAQTAKDLGFEKADKLSPKDTAGLSISYAHMHFKDDPSWDKAFDDAENGDLHIKSVPEYNFSGYNVKAPEGGRVYVINNDTGYVVSDVRHVSRSKVTYISKKNKSKSVFFPTLAKQVKKTSNRNKVQHIVRQVNVGDQDDSEDTNDDEDSNDDSDSDDDSDSSDEDISWNDDKEEELADFMESFGKKMKQDYEEYDGDKSIKTIAGETYPDDFDDRTFKLYSDEDKDGSKIDIGYDPNLEEDYDYHVVAIFNADIGNPEQHITYFFCVHDNQPVVLVDQTTNGDDCMVKETANKDVKSAFAKILASKDSDSDEDTNDDDDDE